MSADSPFAVRLRMFRAKANLTQEALAQQIDVSQNAIGTWERGESSPQVESLVALCKVFGVSADFLVGISHFETGVAPDSWIIDLDVLDAPKPRDGTQGDGWPWHVWAVWAPSQQAGGKQRNGLDHAPGIGACGSIP